MMRNSYVTHQENNLGVVIMDNLRVGDQCASAKVKANRMLGLIKRNIINRSPEIENPCSAPFVILHGRWFPHYKKDKKDIEKVQ